MKILLFIVMFNIAILSASTEQEYLSKEEKVAYTNIAMSTAILGWGYTQWNYTQQSFRFNNEGWFEKDSDEGGADKLGHFFTNYTITHIAASLFESWGYNKNDAAMLAALSSIFQSAVVMELGDGTGAGYGFSREDIVANIAGSLIGYVWYLFPSIASKVDFRVEYAPDFSKKLEADLTTDYENMKHLVAIKAEGFEIFKNSYAKYLELHIGYYARNFKHGSLPLDGRDRYLYAAIGINLSALIRGAGMPTVATFFNYYQTPSTYIQTENSY